MDDKLQQLIKKLQLREGEIIATLIEDDTTYHPEVLLRLIWEARSVRKTLRWLEE